MKLDSAIFYTNNLKKAIDFYKNTVGLSLDYVREDKFASFNLGNGKLGIKQAKEKREMPGHQSLFIATDNIKKDYSRFKKRGIIFLKDLTEEAWAVNFSFLDPDGNKIQIVFKK